MFELDSASMFWVPGAPVGVLTVHSDRTIPVIKRVMEEAPLTAVALTVPLHVAAHAADNWEEAH